jgi:DNA-directed RNA polymerase specialized sigma24 family protein
VQSRWKRKAITNLGYRREEEQNNAESVNDRMNRWNRYSPIDQLIDQEESEMRRNDIEERTRQLRRFLGEHNYQELFEHYGLGVPQQSIAFTRKVPLGTIKSRLHRAKKSAKSRFE